MRLKYRAFLRPELKSVSAVQRFSQSRGRVAQLVEQRTDNKPRDFASAKSDRRSNGELHTIARLVAAKANFTAGLP